MGLTVYDNYARSTSGWHSWSSTGAACSIRGLLRTAWYQARRFDRRPCRQTRRVGDMFDWSTKSVKPARISFYGNFGAGNLGNECTLQAVIEQILRRWPDAKL